MKLSSIFPQRDRSDFGTVSTTTNPVFLARLGFVGVDFGPLGKVAIGKQYAVQYDIAGYTTDRFNVFGGQGTHAYVAGTDGGQTGTGRADRIVNYRNTLLKVLEVGVQGQFRGRRERHNYGRRRRLTPVHDPAGCKGWADVHPNQLVALRSSRFAGWEATPISWPSVLASTGECSNSELVYSHQHNGDVAFVPVPNVPGQTTPIVFDAHGVEVYTRVGMGRFGVIGGYTSQDPKVRDPLLNPDFRTRYFILGAEWFFAKNGKIYSESKIDIDSVTAAGESGYNVFTIGFRYDFSWRTSHQP